MATDLTINDNAGAVVSKINVAIGEQDKGVTPIAPDSYSGTVISRVNDAIGAESNDQLEDVTNSDNAADFIGKVNALFASIRNGEGGGGGDPTTDPIVPNYAYWSELSYIAFGDSITHTSWTIALDKRYCYLAAQELGMTSFTNAGVSGMLMLDNGKYQYPIGKDLNNNGVFDIHDSGVETDQRSFAKELLNPDEITIVDDNVPQVADHRGPYGVNLSEYDLITLMFGTNDINRIFLYRNYPSSQPYPATVGAWGDTDLSSFYGAYTRALDYIIQSKKPGAVVVICVPPACSNVNFKINNIAGAIRDIADRYHLPIVDFYNMPLFDSYGQPTGESYNNGVVALSTDGVHPNETGQQVMAEYFKLRLGQIAAQIAPTNELD